MQSEMLISKKKIVPLNDNVLVKLIIHKTTDGGIILPSGNEEIRTGHIVAIGGGVPDDFVCGRSQGDPLSGTSSVKSRGVKIGDKVFLPRSDKLGDKFEDEGDILLLLPYKYIGAIIEESNT